ncbi:MAG: alpha/beta hydrolase [Actinomycetota bacterium]|nr:alpha/beta hydrolase [Actinomycetota bacterium]
MALTPTTTFATADDGLRLAAHLTGAGSPLLCLPGGPLLDTRYLGDLGGLSSHRRLVLLDPRGSGASDHIDDAAAYRCDRMVADVEAQRRHLGLDTIDLLAHSAGANLAYRYAESFPGRVGRLVLVTPSVSALGIAVPDAARREIAQLRKNESWYPEAAAALASIQDGAATEADWSAIAPFSYGRWDEAVQAYDAAVEARRKPDAAAAFVADGAFDPPATRAALAALDVPVLVLAGGWDVGNPPRVMVQVADLFFRGRLVVQPEAGHFPWVDHPARFRELVATFLAE